MLIGDSDLEEALEHLILDQNDVSQFGDHLLDESVVDLGDYFD